MDTITAKTQTLRERIEASLDNIRPYLLADGGNVQILEVTDDHVLKLEFVGNCGTCAMSTLTFKAGVEEAILKSVPEIKSILVTNLTPL
jgi:Fe-S cluster biogenesis protein NfuA